MRLLLAILLVSTSALAQNRVFAPTQNVACFPNCETTKYNPFQEVGFITYLPASGTTGLRVEVGGTTIYSSPVSEIRLLNIEVNSQGPIYVTEYGASGLTRLFQPVSENSTESDSADEPTLEEIKMWETKEWDLFNPTFSGNPFDLQASATFRHKASGRTITTDLFYAGRITWTFRFTGVKAGEWSYVTQSSDPELNGFSGELLVSEEIDGNGFLTTHKGKFAVQTIDEDFVRPVMFNVFQNRALAFPNTGNVGELSLEEFADNVEFYVRDAKQNGMDVVFGGIIANYFFSNGSLRADTHTNTNPDLDTFEYLERAIKRAHSQGGHIHFWAWGDAERNWVLPGEINGEVDKRLQRYIAARLGPLPGWSMGYGFDLEEWVSSEQVEEWSTYLQSKMDYPRILTARGISTSTLPVESHSELENSYETALGNILVDPSRPQFFEERDVYLRTMDMETTRRLLWQYALAGGHGGFWGYSWNRPVAPYPNPAQLRTYARFWRKHFYFNQVPGDLSLEGEVSVYYSEDSGLVSVDTTGPAYAVDARGAYLEVPVRVEQGAVRLPYASDWAVVVLPDTE